MDFGLTDEQQLLVESVKEFSERYATEDQIKQMYADHKMSEELTHAWLESGFGLMGIPEEYGGVDTDLVTLGLLTEEFAHWSGCMLPTLNNTLAIRDFIDFGASPEQIEAAMASYMESGQPIFSLGFSEPGAGSDNQAMTCTTKKQPDGSYLLSGQKTWVTQGEVFPNVLVIAKDEDPARANKSMSMWLVPRESEGLSTAPLHKIGQQASAFCDMYFDGVVLTEDMRVGEAGKGFLNLMKNFETERCLIVAQCIGSAQAAMDDAAAYASERETFGRPISDYQLIQLKLTEMETALQTSRDMLYKTLWKMDTGQSVRIDSALLKRYAAKECLQVASDAMQIYGGLGYTDETRLGRIWTDLRGMEIAGGTDEIMVYIAGRQLAKQYKRK
jgi:crotonobetainyl-CoA dehydrogenase